MAEKFFFPLVIILLMASCSRSIGSMRQHVISPEPQAGSEFKIMDFSRPIRLNPIEQGWYQYEFYWRKPMNIGFMVKKNKPAIRLSTQKSASMLFRQVEYNLTQFPLLTWSWWIEKPIESTLSEKTPEGDDHPARIYVSFESDTDEERDLELIWGNKITKPGLIFVDSFPLYVVRGGNQNLKKWFTEKVNLKSIYEQVWGPAGDDVVVTDVGLFCDSDDTGSTTEIYIADVSARKKAPDLKATASYDN